MLVELEDLVDKHGLSAVLACLANICNLKAEHIHEMWQDRSTAKAWDAAATRIRNVKVGV